MARALLLHWPEYLIEGALLGTFLFAACLGAYVLEHPDSPLRRAMASPAARRAVMGLLMGLTAVALIYSPWGARSGAHMNPATTLTFFILGKVAAPDAFFYIAAHCIGGVIGVLLADAVLGHRRLAHQSVNYAVTAPGRRGRGVAWAVEFVLAFLMMSAVLLTSNSALLAPYTGLLAGGLVALFIFLGAPLSGMSINPARSLASAPPRPRVPRSVDLLHGAAPGHARRRRAVHLRGAARRLLRQAQPRR